ncbi:hypothetical protein JCM6882_006493 [Rhodosporidiobolus microsporus]
MESTAFNDTFTANHGGSCFFVSVDPAFDTQIAEAASLVARARPSQDDRAQFTASLVDAAHAALPPTPAAIGEEDESEEAESAKATDTPEALEKKRAVLLDLLAALKDAGKLEGVQSDREFEGWSNLVLSLVLALLSGAELEGAVSTLVAVYTSLPTSSSPSSSSASLVPSLPARYTALATLFNALPPSLPAPKLHTLTALAAFAAQNDDAAVLAPTLAALPTIFASLAPSLSAAGEADKAVLSIASALAAHGAQAEARNVLEAHLSSASTTEASESRGKLADLLVALTLSAPDVYDLTPLSSPSLTPASAALAALVDIFLRGDVAAFASASIPTVEVEGVELDRAQLEKKLRLVKLAELCSERVGETVGYAEIKEVLALSGSGAEDEGEEVETWVIDAIRASLLSGRLSQPSQSLSITRALPPSSSSKGLDQKYWKLIQQRLEGWKERVGRVGEAAKRASSSAQAGAAAGGVGAAAQGGREEKGGKDEE